MNNPLHNERGISLIEVVVSILLIGLVLLSFFGLLLQSNKTTVSSDKIMDATYVAQQEMERFYVYSRSASSEKVLLDALGYDTAAVKKDPNLIEKSSEYIVFNNNTIYFSEKNIYSRQDQDFTYTVTVKRYDNNSVYKNLLNILILVEGNFDNSSAEMESTYTLGGA